MEVVKTRLAIFELSFSHNHFSVLVLILKASGSGLLETAPGDWLNVGSVKITLASGFHSKSFGSGLFPFRQVRQQGADFEACFLWGERQHGCASASYSRVCSKAQTHFDCAITQSSRGMSGSYSSTEPVQGRSANARHSQKSTLLALTSLFSRLLVSVLPQVAVHSGRPSRGCFKPL